MNKQTTIHKEKNRAGEMAQLLRGQMALAEDQVGLPASMWDDSQLPATSAPGEPAHPASSGPCAHMYTPTQRCRHICMILQRKMTTKIKTEKEKAEEGGYGKGREGKVSLG